MKIMKQGKAERKMPDRTNESLSAPEAPDADGGILIEFNDEYGWDNPGFSPEDIASRVGTGVLDEENCPYEAEVSLTLTDDEEIKNLNRETRGIDRATDVLSFPMTEYSEPGNFEELENAGWDSFDPVNGRLVLGDIVISVPHVMRQAEEYGHSVMREYAFLIAHSMLHLMGYDHMTEAEENVMFSKQEKILQKLGITRG